MVPWAHPNQPQYGISIGSAVLTGLGAHVINADKQTRRHRDRPRYAVCGNRPLSLAIAVMWPDNNGGRKYSIQVLTTTLAFRTSIALRITVSLDACLTAKPVCLSQARSVRKVRGSRSERCGACGRLDAGC